MEVFHDVLEFCAGLSSEWILYGLEQDQAPNIQDGADITQWTIKEGCQSINKLLVSRSGTFV